MQVSCPISHFSVAVQWLHLPSHGTWIHSGPTTCLHISKTVCRVSHQLHIVLQSRDSRCQGWTTAMEWTSCWSSCQPAQPTAVHPSYRAATNLQHLLARPCVTSATSSLGVCPRKHSVQTACHRLSLSACLLSQWLHMRDRHNCTMFCFYNQRGCAFDMEINPWHPLQPVTATWC